MNTYIYFIRHGEVYNPQKLLYGRLPKFHLSPHGREEVQTTAAFLQNKHITTLYTSPLLRARQTAAIINSRLKLPKIHITKQILEVQSSYQGTKLSDLDPIQSEVYLKPLASTDETVTQMATRMLQFVKTVAKHHKGEHIAFVTHGDPSMSLIAAIEGRPLTFASIRPGWYIQHGEVMEICCNAAGQLTVNRVFTPPNL